MRVSDDFRRIAREILNGKWKNAVLVGLYIGILFVAIGIGIIAMIYRQKFGLWIVIPVLMIGAGVVQIVKCIKR